MQDLQTKCKLTRDFLFLVDSETHRKRTPLQHFSTPVKAFKTVHHGVDIVSEDIHEDDSGEIIESSENPDITEDRKSETYGAPSDEEDDEEFQPAGRAEPKPVRKNYLDLASRVNTRKCKTLSLKKADDEDPFKCTKCGEVFTSGWALGGHASRVHPGESEAYKKKIQRREEREFDRKLLALAKERHQQMYGKDATINRVKIRKFKREIRRQLQGRSD